MDGLQLGVIGEIHCRKRNFDEIDQAGFGAFVREEAFTSMETAK